MSNPWNKLPLPPRDELADLYTRLKSDRLMAKHYGCSTRTVLDWRKHYGIASGPRGVHPQAPNHPWNAGIRGQITPAQWRAYRQVAS